MCWCVACFTFGWLAEAQHDTVVFDVPRFAFSARSRSQALTHLDGNLHDWTRFIADASLSDTTFRKKRESNESNEKAWGRMDGQADST